MQKNRTLPKRTSRCRFNTIIERIHGKSFRMNNWRAAVGCHHIPQWTVTVAVARGNFDDVRWKFRRFYSRETSSRFRTESDAIWSNEYKLLFIPVLDMDVSKIPNCSDFRNIARIFSKFSMIFGIICFNHIEPSLAAFLFIVSVPR
jgi:hypothetical protein